MTRIKIKTFLSWFLQIILGLEFIIAGSSKFFDQESNIRHFEAWGFPDHFYLIVGALEVIGGLLIFIPKLATKASTILGVIMIGASTTHIFHNEWNRTPITILIIVLLSAVYYLRKESSISQN
jgi:uncharacterized membrane protein YphA (DoxX/SURF4 family)